MKRMSGTEPFHAGSTSAGFNVSDFWSWSSSDLVANTTRGVLAEYIVARALDVDLSAPRVEWGRVDLTMPDGTTVEVKSAAYLQAWHQQKLSQIRFGAHRSFGWNPDTGTQDDQSLRQADLYVFALLAHKDKATLDPLELGQWKFYVAATSGLDSLLGTRKHISLSTVERIAALARFHELKDVVKLTLQERA